MKRFQIVAAVLLAAHSFSVQADPAVIRPAAGRPAVKYVVSGVLRSAGEGVSIRLVQGFQVASSPDEAIGAFSRAALAKYPGSAVIDTVATPIAEEKARCGTAI